MTDAQEAVVGTLLAAQTSAILLLAFVLVKTRERLVRLEQRLDDVLRRVRRRDVETS